MAQGIISFDKYYQKMKSTRYPFGTLILTTFLLGTSMIAPGQRISPVVVGVDKPKALIQPTMWGIFFEDINFAADGGLYAELVKNRSFRRIDSSTIRASRAIGLMLPPQ
jgi:hypothetical protein